MFLSKLDRGFQAVIRMAYVTPSIHQSIRLATIHYPTHLNTFGLCSTFENI